MALLGSMTAASLHAEEKVVMWDGVTYDEKTLTVTGAVTSYKHEPSEWRAPAPGDTGDCYMCGPASASNVLAWWLDRVEQNGALIVRNDVPRDYAVWEEVRKLYINKAVNASWVLQFWLTGYTDMSKDQWMTEEGKNFKGYFPHLSGGYYKFRGDVRPENCITNQIKADGSQPAETYIAGTYQEASKALVEGMQDGWGFVLDVGTHYMTVYGVGINDEGNITSLIFSDNNNSTSSNGFARQVDVYPTSSSKTGGGDKTMGGVGYGNEIVNYYGLRSKGLTFDTYTMTMTGAAGEEDLFSHYLNLVVDGHQNYELKYDLRSADADDSPVDPILYKYNQYYEVVDKEKVTTGDITLKDGTLSLVDKGGEFDGGGKTTGYIAFEDKAGATRKLSVQHTATIAEEIKVNAANGNTLEVTEGNTASFGSLTGTGNLEKTGAGTLLYDGSTAGSVTLSVKEGTLKGSGTFAGVIVDGGTLVVGNSPGRQEYLGALSVNAGEIMFSVDGWETPANEEQVGWGSGTYSNIVMNGNALTFADGASLEFAVAGDALAAMFDNSASGFTLEIATGIGNAGYFTSDLLKMLAEETIFYVANEPGATIVNDAGLSAGENLNAHITDLVYTLKDNTTLCVTGVFMRETPPVPEPATGTLGLLALAGLAARRRRK